MKKSEHQRIETAASIWLKSENPSMRDEQEVGFHIFFYATQLQVTLTCWARAFDSIHLD